MNQFEEVKNRFSEQYSTFQKLCASCAQRILLRDIARISEQMGERIVPSNNGTLILDGNIILRPNNNGRIEIEDRRKTAFLWLFEIQLHSDMLACGPSFKHEGKLYSVDWLQEFSFEGAFQKVQELLENVENGIRFLQSNPGPDGWQYDYYDAHEDKTCKSLEKVLEIVLSQEPW